MWFHSGRLVAKGTWWVFFHSTWSEKPSILETLCVDVLGIVFACLHENHLFSWRGQLLA